MKKFSIFTLAIVALTVAALQLSHAQQQAAEALKSEPQNSVQPQLESEVTEHNPEAVDLLRRARTALFNYETLQAKLTQRANLGTYHFTADGSYSSASGFRSRLQYNVELGEMEGHFTEVSDGQILHTRREVGPKKSAGKNAGALQIDLARRDIQKILQETQKQLEQPEPRASQAMQAAEIGIGGLPAILASLERVFFFDSVKNDAVNGQPVKVIQGRSNPTRVSELVGGLGAIGPQVSQFLPEVVRITLQAETLFPQKIQYLKLVNPENNVYEALLSIEFTEVVINQPLPGREFTYSAQTGLEERDETAIYLQTILGVPETEATATDVENPTAPPQN